MSAIDPAAEAEAIADWKAGDLLAGDRLIRMHAGLIYTTVRRYVTDRCELDDLLQVGRWALLRAALKHEATLGRLSTYASRKIRGAALALMRRARSIVRTPLRERDLRVSVASLDAPTDCGFTLLDNLVAPEIEDPSCVNVDALVDAHDRVLTDERQKPKSLLLPGERLWTSRSGHLERPTDAAVLADPPEVDRYQEPGRKR